MLLDEKIFASDKLSKRVDIFSTYPQLRRRLGVYRKKLISKYQDMIKSLMSRTQNTVLDHQDVNDVSIKISSVSPSSHLKQLSINLTPLSSYGL